MLLYTKKDFGNFRKTPSNSATHSSTSDEATTNYSSVEKDSTDSEVNSLDIELSASYPPDFELSSASFVIDFDEKSFECHLKPATSHLKDCFGHSSYSSETSVT